MGTRCGQGRHSLQEASRRAACCTRTRYEPAGHVLQSESLGPVHEGQPAEHSWHFLALPSQNAPVPCARLVHWPASHWVAEQLVQLVLLARPYVDAHVGQLWSVT
jgi:hypothetical protein